MSFFNFFRRHGNPDTPQGVDHKASLLKHLRLDGSDYFWRMNRLRKKNANAHVKAVGFNEYQHIGTSVSEFDRRLITEYCSGSAKFNRMLGNVNAGHLVSENDRIMLQKILDLNAALSRLPNSTEVTYRGMDTPIGIWGSRITENSIVQNTLFMSATLSVAYAQMFAACRHRIEQGALTMLMIYGRTAKNVSKWSNAQGTRGDSQYIFQPFTAFQVIGMERRAGRVYAILSEIPEWNGPAQCMYSGELIG